MKTVVRINPEKEYSAAKMTLESISSKAHLEKEVKSLDDSIENMRTVINVFAAVFGNT